MNDQQNVAVVKQLYQTFARQDIEALPAVLAEDVDWLFYGPDAIPFAGHYQSRQEVQRFFQIALDTIEFLEFTPYEFIPAAGGRVLVQGHEQVRAKATGRTWDTDWVHVFTLNEGKITKLREYYDTAAIVAAFKKD